jgi:hypothetical protein
MYVVASRCSQNHFIYKKYKTVQSFKLHFLQNSPFEQLNTSTSDCKGVGYIPGGHFVKAFLALLSHILNDVSSITKAPSLHC